MAWWHRFKPKWHRFKPKPKPKPTPQMGRKLVTPSESSGGSSGTVVTGGASNTGGGVVYSGGGGGGSSGGSSGGSGGGSSSTPTSTSALASTEGMGDQSSITESTGTGYNPATGVQEGVGGAPKNPFAVKSAGQIALTTTSEQSLINQNNQRLYPGQSPKMVSSANEAQWGYFKKNYGKVKGSVLFAGDWAGRQYKGSEYQKASENPGQYQLWNTEATGNIIGAGVTTGAYINPITGPPLLLAGGVEDIGTKSGRQRINVRGETLGEQLNIGKTGGIITSYGITGAEIGLGALGVRGQYKTVQSARTTALLNKAPVTAEINRVQTSKGGVDFIQATKTTKPTWADKNLLNIKQTQISSEIVQPYYNVGTSKSILEGGTGRTYSYRSGDSSFNFQNIQTSGRSYSPDVSPTYTTKVNGMSVKTELPDFSSSYGKVTATSTSGGNIKVGGEYNPIKSSFNTNIKVTGTPGGQTSSMKFVGGGVETGEGTSKIFGGEASKLFFNTKTGNQVLRSGKINFFGNVKTINAGSGTSKIFSTGGSNLKSIFSGGSNLGYQEAVTRTAFNTQIQSIVPRVNPFLPTSFYGSVTANIPVTKTVQSTYTIPKLEVKTNQKEYQRVSIGQIQAVDTSTKQKTRGYSASSSIQIPKVIQQPKQGITPIQGIKEIPVVDTIQRNRNPFLMNPAVAQPEPYTPKFPIGFLPPPTPKINYGSMGSRTFKGERKYSYTPDFKSLFFGIKGKAPTKSKYLGYGEQARPIIIGGKKPSMMKGMDDRIKANAVINFRNFFRGWQQPKKKKKKGGKK